MKYWEGYIELPGQPDFRLMRKSWDIKNPDWVNKRGGIK